MGKNIKQLTNRSLPELTDFLYTVAGDTDYNVKWSDVKIMLGIEEVGTWQTESITANTSDNYINLVDGVFYGAVKLEYIVKRGTRGFRTGIITIMLDDSNANEVTVSDVWEVSRTDGNDLGIILDNGVLSAGTIQLQLITDGSDVDPTIFNYKIISQRPITV